MFLNRVILNMKKSCLFPCYWKSPRQIVLPVTTPLLEKISTSHISLMMAYFLHTTAIATYVTVLSFSWCNWFHWSLAEIFLPFVKCMSFQTSGYSTYVIREAVGNSFFCHFTTILTFQTLQTDSNLFFEPTNPNLRGLLQIKVVFHKETEF